MVSLRRSRAAGSSFAIATVTRSPHRFDRWLAYHQRLGAARLFVCVEETPSALAHCTALGALVRLRHARAAANPYETIIQRQEAHVDWALAECARLGIAWLVHCDDDELLFLGARFESVAAACPREASCIVISNVEAVPSTESSDFTTISTFCFDDDGFLAYVNGKSAGRVGHCRAFGCHRFSGVEWEAPRELICILHFESCPYSRWHDKFRHYARLTRPTRHTNMPFRFYVDSIAAHREAQAAREAGALEDSIDARLRAFWRKRKQRHYLAYSRSFVTIHHYALDEADAHDSRKRRRCTYYPSRPALLPAPSCVENNPF
ncbi:hypothetical protein AB1Y20_005678 [Prymnesium parvum]|uniref:Glycosyltransferase family 92 protein n=1 Tax=Prymnesium parvum TaxID=97485 RepID=A0AB34J7V4_PRYPA